MNRSAIFAVVQVVALLVLCTLSIWATTRYHNAMSRAERAETAAHELRTQLTNAQSATVTVTQYVDRERVIRLKGETIVKEVPRYVPIQADAACVVPRGFVRLHDAAAAGAVPAPDTGDADAAASGVALSAVAGTVAGNYTDSHANSEQLKALQQALRDQGVTIIGERMKGNPAP
ncbi:hypothetical protein LMG19089_04950 [Ralstonia edaphis]|uniref:hypothetical protein n=1 Tax=Ralstonia edaphi TaxID=3058599 RepID=UPI0028F59BEC|nr:hypothetical protein [Ralstonia sp. LMG 6871]CAJ0709321.1 hypothetical protein LMG19089_04950 [Ralstonia sp. LMG 6871]